MRDAAHSYNEQLLKIIGYGIIVIIPMWLILANYNQLLIIADWGGMESIGGSNLLKEANVNITPTGSNLFELQIEANHPLVFIPENWKSTMSVPIKSTVSGKVMLR